MSANSCAPAQSGGDVIWQFDRLHNIGTNPARAGGRSKIVIAWQGCSRFKGTVMRGHFVLCAPGLSEFMKVPASLASAR